MAKDRARDPRRVVKIYNKSGFTGSDTYYPGDYKLSDNSILSSSDDEKAQLTFKKRGYNKGKAKDIAKNVGKRAESSIPTSSSASRDYEPSFSALERHNTQAGDK